MSCGCFKTHIATTATVAPDPTKHVNYQLGMVLGVDDFNQEFAYLAGRDQWLARDLLGYGTVRGLRVHYETDGAQGPRVIVDAGAALSPSGQLICVPAAQCATLNHWLAAHAREVNDRLGAPVSATLPVYVVLCYRVCPTDEVPIPGEPCRSEDELKAPSRLADDFQLELRFAPPRQREEDAVRDFVAWLRRVAVSDTAPSATPLADFLQAIRDAAQPWLTSPASPLASPPGDFMFGAPPPELQLRPQDLCDYLRAALRLWVTELRPRWLGRWYGCAPDLAEAQAEADDCVLLARVDVPVLLNSPGAWVVSDVDPVEVDDDRRPFVVHLRMLQEWLLCGLCCTEPGGLTSPLGPGPTVPILTPGNTVSDETAFGISPPRGGSSLEYSRADHTHGTPTLPNLGGDVTGPITSNLVNRLTGTEVDQTLPAVNQVLACVDVGGGVRRWRATSLPTALNGDVTGQFNSNTVNRIRNVLVEGTPTAGQVLTAVQVGTAVRWRPAAPPPPAGSFVQFIPPAVSGINSYAIVAAGIASAASRRAPTYNNLELSVLTTGLLRVRFNGYEPPILNTTTNTFSHHYIVKVLPMVHSTVQLPNNQLLNPTVSFVDFEAPPVPPPPPPGAPIGIILRVANNGVLIEGDILRRLEFMIEISRFPLS